MMNKKLVGTALVGLMTIGFAGQVLADQVNDPKGTSNVKGSNSGKMEVRGNLGEIDNENPETPIEEGSDEWINVTFPTSTIFGQGEQNKITSPKYTITNNSGRHVNVTVSDYIIDAAKSDAVAVAALKELNIEEPAGEKMKVNLATEGVSSVDPGANSLGKINTKDTLNFSFTGEVGDTTGLGDKAFVESHVVFTFKALAKEGNEK